MELFKCLPMIEDLTISNRLFQFWWFYEDLYSKGLNGLELRTSLDHLQCFRVEDMYFTGRMDLVFILSVIRCSPNLEKFKLHMFGELKESEWNSRTESVTHEDYPDIWLENLNELEIFNFGNSKQELDLVKLILANSPMLKKLSLFPYRKITKDEEMSLLEILLHSPRASPMVEQLIVKK
uniref:uncharacterized protein LOC122580117 n=1 Tax=Erigeron canadensis TaxID=72917 RepID=UPI001CB969B9|nr:uncharacterized protein LOC122580117 [Erigeron canadensis]